MNTATPPCRVLRSTLVAFLTGMAIVAGTSASVGCDGAALCDCAQLEELIPSGAFAISSSEAPDVDFDEATLVDLEGDDLYVEYAVAGTDARVGVSYHVVERVIE